MAEDAAPKTGRPSTYAPETATEILRLMSEEGAPLNRACRTVGLAKATFLGWVNADHDGLSDRYAKARHALLEYWADDIIDIADESSRDTITSMDGREVPNAEWISRSRLRVDSRKWLLSKLRPEQYGDKSDINIGGQRGAPAVQTETVIRWAD